MTALYVLGLLAAYVAGFVNCGIINRRIRLRRLPPSMVNGMLMPLPSDERWRSGGCDYPCPGCWSIGAVEACLHHGTFVGKTRLNGRRSGRYARAVVMAQVERLALKAALGDDA